MISKAVAIEEAASVKIAPANTQAFRILLIESDFYLSSSFQADLASKGYEVSHVRYSNLLEPKLKLNILAYKPDLILLDASYRSKTLLAIIRELRSFFYDLLVVLSSNHSQQEEIDSFDLGVDEYLIKPLPANILAVRLAALLRRKAQPNKSNKVDKICLADLCLMINSQKCLINQEVIKLTSFEFNLLNLLLLNQGSILSRDEIYLILLGRVYNGSERTVDVRVSQLREKLLSGGMSKCQIETVWGKGYMLSVIKE